MDVVQVIEADHRHIERAFERFGRAARGGDERQQAEMAREILRQLSVHAAIEEQVLYPALSRAGIGVERIDALEEHHAVKVTLSEIQAMTLRNERFAAKMRVVEKSVRRHIEEEESTILPCLRDAVDAESLHRLGTELEAAKRSAPTRPHPTAPDVPPANLFANAWASVLDRLMDTLEDAGDLLGSTVRSLLRGTVRFGRDAVMRARREGEEMVAQARAGGERAVEQTRAVGTEIAESAAEQGAEVARRIEYRGASTSRQLQRRVGTGAKRRARKKRR